MKSTSVLLSMLATFAAAAAPRVEPLRSSDIDYGCGCSFFVPFDRAEKGAMVLQWELGERANIRVDGTLQKLNVITDDTSAILSWSGKEIGAKQDFTLVGTHLEVHIHCTVLEACKPEMAGCEITKYRAKINLRSSTGSSVLDSWGSCGC